MTAAALIAARVAAGLLAILVTGYGAGALWFRGPQQPLARAVLIGLWSIAGAAALAGLILPHWLGPALFAMAGLAFAIWWSRIQPAADRDWAPDVARTLGVARRGSRVRLYNVRNFDWHTRNDFSIRWETRDYDLDDLIAVDLVASYWSGPTIAHTLVSFAFADGRHLVFSVEVRRLAGSEFSAVGGLFRQCELALVAADERDIVRTRSNARGEDVYLYRVALPPAEIRALFAAYLDTADTLAATPRFYNTLTSNCTTLVYDLVKPIVPGLPWNWRLLASGYLPEYLYRIGGLDSRLSLAALHQHGHINERALAADAHGDDFSQAIRRGLPAPANSAQPPP
ncbi:DUF4105 domain-containing protein [Salinisphaera sp. SPP-AMP-43]|uniref:Lnb N-terminal periplasmic domain-containing protein n=1 Tax=Salinisphaera sp. SPP-AMP-43 TaxID=3121288 RepID=UPI003C6E3B64